MTGRCFPGLVALALVLAVLGPATGLAAPDGSCAAPTEGRPVVVLVHGFNDTPTPRWDAVSARLEQRHSLYIERFDYSADHGNTRWVTAENIGPALAQRIACLAEQSSAQGGPGKVIAVGHSMGGLAIRCALQPECSHVQGVDASVAQVITVGTPTEGSYLRSGGVVNDLLRKALYADCRARFIVAVGWADPCGYVQPLLTSPAAQAFSGQSPELTELRKGTTSVPVLAIAGHFRLQTTILGTTVDLGDGGDFVVGKNSQLAWSTEQAEVDCGSLNLRILSGLPHDHEHSGSAVTCWHGDETENAKVLDIVEQRVTTIGGLLWAGRDPREARYSSTCGGASPQPFAVRLVDGAATATTPGGESFSIGLEAVAQGDLTGDGTSDTAVLLSCSPQPSNFTIPEVVVLLGDRPEQVSLPLVDPFDGLYPGPVYSPDEFGVRRGRLVTGIDDYGPDDSHADVPSLHYVYEWQWTGSEFEPHRVSGTSPVPPTTPQPEPSPSPATGLPPGPGTYSINREIYRDSVWTLTLTAIEVQPDGRMRVDVRYEKLADGPQYAACSTTPSPDDTYITLEDGQRLEWLDHYCVDRPDERQCDSPPPCVHESWAIFPGLSDRGTRFSLYWFGWGTVTDLQLPS